MKVSVGVVASIVVIGPVLASCADDIGASLALRAAAPVPEKTVALMADKGMARQSPILIRSFKKESELEVWKLTRGGDYALLKVYPICRWSGQLGPKTREGDRQAPEGFYSVTPASLNPNSRLYLSFDMNYPNSYDRVLGRTGTNLMVHGACSSAGCYSMSDEQMMEIYALLRDSFAGGQAFVQMQALPFRMTAENLARHRLDPNMPFWRNLKEGTDRFEVGKRPPTVAVCGKRYVFDAKPKDPAARFDPMQPCPALEDEGDLTAAIAAKIKQDEISVSTLVNAGEPAVKLLYQDGSQHSSFRAALASGTPASRLYGASSREYQNISRADALKDGPQEIVVSTPPPVSSASAEALPQGSKVRSIMASPAAPSLYERMLSATGTKREKP
jgi:murein L,D-transpeptidase YafK